MVRKFVLAPPADKEQIAKDLLSWGAQYLERQLKDSPLADREDLLGEALKRFYQSQPYDLRASRCYLARIIDRLICDYATYGSDSKPVEGQGSRIEALSRIARSGEYFQGRNLKLIEMSASGMNSRHIAKALGYSARTGADTVSDQLKQLRGSGRYWDIWLTDKRKKELCSLLQQGASYSKIAQALNITRSRAQHICRKIKRR